MKIIALTGKGGVGKTSLSAAIVRSLVDMHPDKKILAIDADPAVGLSTVLNIEVKKTIDDIRKDIIDGVESSDTRTVAELLAEAKYQLYDAIVEQDGYSFIAIGRPEAAGCYCKINTYLKEVIALLSENYDYVVIDGEAGIEQINRRVMEKVTHLILVTDASKKGCEVIKTIKSVADDLVMYEKAGVIANRLPSKEIAGKLNLGELNLLAAIATDDELAVCDINGDNVFALPEEAQIMQGARQALIMLGL